MLTLQEVKQYLSVDFDDDDILLESLMCASETALKQITNRNTFIKDLELAKLYCLAWISQLYDDRGLISDAKKEKLKFTMRTILVNLKHTRDEGDTSGQT